MTQGVARLTARGQQWLEIVQEWKGSGLARREFCVRRGVNPATLSWWCQELKRIGAEGARGGAVELVEITRNRAPADTGFEIALANGLRVRVPMRFDAVALKQLLAVLVAC